MIFPLAISASIILVIGFSISMYNYLSGKKLIRDVLFFRKIDGHSLTHWDDYCSANPKKSEIIVSLTSIPSRIHHIAPTIKSLLAQKISPKSIHIYLPQFSIREQTTYVIPEILENLRNVKIIRIETDWGPSCKFIPAIASLPPQQQILVVDDDNIYPDTYIDDFQIASQNHPDFILAASGWRVPDDLVDRPTTLWSNVWKIPPTPVTSARVTGLYWIDIVQGYSGFLINPRFFEVDNLTDFSGAPPEARFVDDVWISAHARVPKFVFSMRRFCFTLHRKQKFYKSTSLAKINNWGKKDYTERNNSIVIRHFNDRWQK